MMPSPLETERREHAQALKGWQTEGQQLRQQLERAQSALAALQDTHAEVQQTLTDTRLALHQWQERAAGLEHRVAERDVQLKSLEDKYAHAHETLNHFRHAAKDQRDQELRRHEHERRSLQVELRHAQESLAGKVHDLLQLNRDNATMSV